jgi:hypothetical protein
MRQIAEGRFFPILIGLGYLALALLLGYGVAAWTKPQVEVMLTRLAPKVLWVNFLLIAAAVVLCRRDLVGAIRRLFAGEETGATGEQHPPSGTGAAVAAGGPAPAPAGGERERKGGQKYWALPPLFNRPGLWLLAIVVAGLILVSQAAPQIHRIYYDEDIYANMAQNIARTGQAGMANYATFEYGEYQLHWLLYNKDPSGWPFLISLIFQLFGTDEAYAFALNNLLFAGGIVIVFFITRLLGGSPFGAAAAALIYALIPHNLLWANTISAENPAAVLGGLVVLCTLVWLRTRAARHLFLLAAVTPFACTMRPESALIVLFPLAAAAMNLFAAVPAGARPAAAVEPASAGAAGDAPRSGEKAGSAPRRHPLATRRLWALGLVAFALIIPHIWHFYAMSGQSWGAPGAKFAADFLAGNLAVNGPYYFNNREFPLLFTLLALAGLAAWIGRPATDPRRLDRRSAGLVPLWFFLFWTIFLFFYAGSYKYGADVRFALLCFMPLAVLGGLGGEALKNGGQALISSFLSPPGGRPAPFGTEGAAPAAGCSATPSRRPPLAALLILVLLLSWLKFLPLIRTEGQEAWGARYDHHHAREFIREIPARSIVLTHVPTMFLLWGQNAIQAYAGINNPDIVQGLMARYDGHVYFHKSYWCNTASEANRAICDGIAQRYDLETVAVAREQTHEYGLYRMTPKH